MIVSSDSMDTKVTQSKDKPATVPVNRQSTSSDHTYPPSPGTTRHNSQTNSNGEPSDLPPPYVDESPRPPPATPSNYVMVSRRDDSVKGTWLLDPTLHIPDSLLPPLGWFQTSRKNMVLESKYSSVDANITVPNVNYRERVTITLKSSHGSVNGKIHRSNGPRILLDAKSDYSSVTIYIPRSFHGPLDTKIQYGSTKFSDQIKANLRTFSDVDGKMKGFIGDPTAYVRGEGKHWDGDEASLESAYSTVRVYYDDEITETLSFKSFFAKLF